MLLSHVNLRQFLLQFPEEGLKRSKMAYHFYVRRKHQSFLWRIHGTTSSHFVTHNFTINGNNLFGNFCWTFTFCVEKLYDRTHLSFDRTLNQCCHFKHVSLKQSQCCRNNHKEFLSRPTDDVSFLSGHALYISTTYR